MCGIAGIVSEKSISNINLRLDKMIESIKHRGPDAQKYQKIDENAYFAHVRLSIIDLNDISNQPMISNDKRWSIVFNGEIINYKYIKSLLNYDFKTESDTEVILAAVQEKGIEWFLNIATGMYAIALYDKENKITYLLRDRLGIKPLYYTITNGALVFASEIKGLLNSGLVKAELFDESIDEYLGNRYVREPYTFFKNIYQVGGGEYIKVEKDLHETKINYYQLPRQNFNQIYDEDKLILETKNKLEHVVLDWSIADVSLGTYLSGGVDSSLTTAILAQKESRPLYTYTIGFEEENEFNYSNLVAKMYNTNHTALKIDIKEYLNEWRNLISFSDSPLGVPNEIPLAVMSRELREKITVVISGEGADELFGGYGRIFRSPFKNENNTEEFYDSFIREYEYVPREFRDKYLKTSSNLRNHFDSIIKEDFKKYKNEENVFRFFQDYHIKGLLKRLDTTTMQASIEARPPFLDHRLIEYVNSNIPYDLKLKWKSKMDEELAQHEKSEVFSEKRDTPKYILKKVAEYYLPDEVIYRKKVGFPVPLTTWFENLSSLAESLLMDAQWLNTKFLEELINHSKSNKRAGQIIWMFLNIEIFIQEYFQKEWRY